MLDYNEVLIEIRSYLQHSANVLNHDSTVFDIQLSHQRSKKYFDCFGLY